jgi:hypothetical protein
MVKVNGVSSAGVLGHHAEDVQLVPLLGLGWRCDLCGEMAGQERAPAPERCPRCSGAHFTSTAAWRERFRMGRLSLDGETPEVPPNPADPLPDPPRPVPDLPPGVPAGAVGSRNE